MNAKVFLIVGLLFFGGAVYALHTDKMRVTTVCRDARLYMDGGVDTEIESGGLNYHHDAKLFRRVNNKDVYLGTYVINLETPPQAAVQVLASGNDLKLSIFKDQPQTPHGYKAHLDANFNKEKISVNVECMAKNI